MLLKMLRRILKNKIKGDIRVSNLFKNWGSYKFDYIINDVSGISNVIAKRSPWFKKIVPCDTGVNGTNLSNKIIINSKIFEKRGDCTNAIDKLIKYGKYYFFSQKIFFLCKSYKKSRVVFPKELTLFEKRYDFT